MNNAEAKFILQGYRPNGAVGGDFFDVLSLSDTCAGLFICDVMGHGVRAALVTAMVRALVESLRPLAHEPGQLLGEMNRDLQAIFGHASVPVFLSAFYATIDTVTGQFLYANAGHPFPLVVRRSEAEVSVLPMPPGMPGPPLCVRDQVTYQVSSTQLAPGDCVVLFTDGVYEVVGTDQEPYGEQRLQQAIIRRLL